MPYVWEEQNNIHYCPFCYSLYKLDAYGSWNIHQRQCLAAQDAYRAWYDDGKERKWLEGFGIKVQQPTQE